MIFEGATPELSASAEIGALNYRFEKENDSLSMLHRRT
jgi:hypothetical protein